MSAYDELFESCILQVISPQASLEFPKGYSGSRAAEWLSRAGAPSTDRTTAFFDESLDFLLTVHFPTQDSPESESPAPPLPLLSFLAHLQVSYDASYIAPAPDAPPVPPRRASAGHRKSTPLLTAHPSIFPPQTPLPIPSAADTDRRYVQAQGTLLKAGVWGERDAEPTSEDFELLWSSAKQEWVAVYKMSLLVSFMITRISDPLLCLTVSITLREKPLPFTTARQTLSKLIDAVGGVSELTSSSPTGNGDLNGAADDTGDDEGGTVLKGLTEVNLLEGLSTDPTFASSATRLTLPTTRLGPTTRLQAFSLAPVSSTVGDTKAQTPSTAHSTQSSISRISAHATLRKSFRKTLHTVSGFRVRMRTVFVPYFLMPQGKMRSHKSTPKLSSDDDGNGDGDDRDSDDDLNLDERDQVETGNEEHTVVLSVEIANAGDAILPLTSSSKADDDVSSVACGFEVEGVKVVVGGEGARTVLISWEQRSRAEDVFPLSIGPNEQVNLLYAVSFLRAPDADDLSLAKRSSTGMAVPSTKTQDMQRAVTINIDGKPFIPVSQDDLLEATPFTPATKRKSRIEATQRQLLYPTHTYPSRWNCVLDLSASPASARSSRQSPALHGALSGNLNTALPTPASPFPTAPTAAPLPFTPRVPSMLSPAVAGSKRRALIGNLASPVNYQSPTAMLNPANQPQIQMHSPLPGSPIPPSILGAAQGTLSRRTSYMPPSLAMQQADMAKSPTTYGSPISPPLPAIPFVVPPTHSQTDSTSTIGSIAMDPRTPAYPAFPGSPPPVPPTPFWQGPITQQTGAGAVGPSVEISRDRAPNANVPPTPGPRLGGFGAVDMSSVLQGAGAGPRGEPVVVSVGLLPSRKAARGRLARNIYPLDQFTLDIFVFNQSSWTRRFEVSYPEERRRRRRGPGTDDGSWKTGASVGKPGILPLENRVRVGPLLPSTCQSVRMDFLALAPGVHSIEELILTDIQTGFTMHLRSVIDIVVHEPDFVAPVIASIAA